MFLRCLEHAFKNFSYQGTRAVLTMKVIWLDYLIWFKFFLISLLNYILNILSISNSI